MASKSPNSCLIRFKKDGKTVIIERVGTLGQSADGKIFWGQCSDPSENPIRIRIVKRAKKKFLLELLLHECLHLYCWELSESTVNAYANKMANILWSLGYRRLEELEIKS